MDLDRENLEVKIAYLESEQDKLERALNQHHERLYKAELLIARKQMARLAWAYNN